jgi:hypothetical protein
MEDLVAKEKVDSIMMELRDMQDEFFEMISVN